MAEYDKHNLFDTALILDYLDGILLSDVQQMINREMQSSEDFKTFVEGVKTTYQEAGNDRAKMQANLDKEKAISMNRLRTLFSKKPNLIQEAVAYTTAQLIQFFTPIPRFDLTMNRRGNMFLKSPEQDAAITKDLVLDFHKSTSSPIECAIINNEENELLSFIIPAHSEQYTINISKLRPGVYYLDLVKEDSQEMIRFYIDKHLKPRVVIG